MSSSSSPRFVLKPWEFEGVPYSPLADAVTRCEWDGRTVLMRLKVRENLLLFAPVGEKDGRLFALTTPVDVSEEAANGWKTRPDELKEKFKREYVRGDACLFVSRRTATSIPTCRWSWRLFTATGASGCANCSMIELCARGCIGKMRLLLDWKRYGSLAGRTRRCGAFRKAKSRRNCV